MPGVSLLDQRKVPRYVLAVYAGEKLTLPMPQDSNWLFDSCSVSATDLQLMKHWFVWNHFSFHRGGKKNHLEGHFVEVLHPVFLGPILLDHVLKLFGSSLFCSSCLSAWWEIVVLRRPRTARLLTARGGGKTSAAQVTLGIEMHAW